MTTPDQPPTSEATHKRITAATLLSILAVVTSIAAFGLSFWQHLQDASSQQDKLHLRLEPDYKDYRTVWVGGGFPFPWSIDTRWNLRIVNLSARAAAITSIDSIAGDTVDRQNVHGSSLKSLNNDFLAYNGTQLTLPMTIEPGGSVSLVLTIPVRLAGRDASFRKAFPEEHLQLLSKINSAFMKATGFDVYGNRLQGDAIHGWSGRVMAVSNQKIRIEVSTARGSVFTEIVNVAGHHDSYWFPRKAGNKPLWGHLWADGGRRRISIGSK